MMSTSRTTVWQRLIVTFDLNIGQPKASSSGRPRARPCPCHVKMLDQRERRQPANSQISQSAATLLVRSCMQQRAVVGYDRVRLEGTLATAARIWREEGGRGFYRGIWAHMVRSTPQASVTLLAYENILRLLSTA